jgi:hypothetical protein
MTHENQVLKTSDDGRQYSRQIGITFTTTVACRVSEPNVHVRTYELCSVMFEASCDPEVPLAEKLFGPVTAHDFALVEVHEMVEDCPCFTRSGVALTDRSVGVEPSSLPPEGIDPTIHDSVVHALVSLTVVGTHAHDVEQLCPPFPEEVQFCEPCQ